MMPWGHHWVGAFGGYNPLWSVLMMFVMFLFWAGVLVGIYFLVRSLVRAGQSRPAPHSGAALSGSHALEILKERYARGEVTREQYEEMRRDLAS